MSFPTGINGIILGYLLDFEEIGEWIGTQKFEIFEWVCNTFHPGKEWYLNKEIFASVCIHGTLQMVQFLKEKISLTREEYDLYNGLMFGFACANGKLELAKWLYDQFPMSRDGFIRLENNERTFLNTCANGHLNIVIWLAEIFKIDKWILYTGPIFESTCTNGYLNVAKWLKENLMPINMYDKDVQDLIKDCYENNHLSVCKWLFEQYSISKDYSTLDDHTYDKIMSNNDG